MAINVQKYQLLALESQINLILLNHENIIPLKELCYKSLEIWTRNAIISGSSFLLMITFHLPSFDGFQLQFPVSKY